MSILAALGAACGGGGDEGISYVGNRGQAVITADNFGPLAENVLVTSDFGYIFGAKVAPGRQPAAPAKLSLTGSALQVRSLARQSLQNAGVTITGAAARSAARSEINETEFCDSGISRITGFVENNLTGSIQIDYQQCRYGATTFDGKINWQINSVDQSNLLPTRSIFKISALTVSFPSASVTIHGEISNYTSYSADNELLDLKNLIVRDNYSAHMSMASSLSLFLQYDEVNAPNYVDQSFRSGRVYDSIHGYVDVVSTQPLHYAGINDSYASSGVLRLSAVGILTITALSAEFLSFELDSDQPPDGIVDFNGIVTWDMLGSADPSTIDDDYDNDGISDAAEFANGLDPLDAADATFDNDFDGVDNLREYLAGTGLNDADSMPPLSNLWQPPPDIAPASGNYVYLESRPGDRIGGGSTSIYTDADSILTAAANGGLFDIDVATAGSWSGRFELPAASSQLAAGYYGHAVRQGFQDPLVPGLSWSGMGRACNTLAGWFIIDSVTYDNGNLSSIDLRFGQHCENNPAALYGQIHWTDAPPAPPPPPGPPPPGLWQPAPGATPDGVNYIYLESDVGDYVGQGGTYLYTQADSILSFTASGGLLGVSVDGNENWNGNFKSPDSLTRLEAGYYSGLDRYPFHNPLLGGLSWSGEGRGCNQLSGWFVVDSVTYDVDTLTAIDLRFEQHCEKGTPALRGELHWQAGDTTSPAGPVDPPPAGLWQAPSGVTPASGDYVYIESETGDYVGAGGIYFYDDANSTLTFTGSAGLLQVSVAGGESWSGYFRTMDNIVRFEPGYYGDLQRYPFHNTTRGGLSWFGRGNGCNALTGWFVVDSVAYDVDTLTAIELRFEQHCEGALPALHGQLRWSQ